MAVNQVALDELLAGTVSAVLDAQDQLDQYATERTARYENAKPGEPVLPPLWYNFDNIGLELSVNASVSKTVLGKSEKTRLFASTTSDRDMALFGKSLSTTLKVKLDIAHYSKAAIQEVPLQDISSQQEPLPAENQE